jgi:hypothetical protein
MRDAQIPQRRQRRVIDVRELAAAIFSECAMRFVGGFVVSKMPHHELVDYRALRVEGKRERKADYADKNAAASWSAPALWSFS